MSSRRRVAWAGSAVLAGLVVLAGAGTSAQEPPEKRIPVEITAQKYQYSPETGLAHGEGDVVVRYQDILLTADAVDVNFRTWDVAASGSATLKRGDFVWQGEAVSGNIERKSFVFGTFDVTTGVWYGHGESGTHDERGVAEVQGVRLSTCDLENPHYSIHARRVLHYPDGTFRAYGAVVRIRGVPVFYVPVMFGDTNREQGSVQIEPGYSGDWGAFLLLSRTWQVSEEVDTTLKVDLRSRNGLALGNETHVRRRHSRTDLEVYGMYDLDAPEQSPSYAPKGDDDYNRRFEAEDWRYRAAVYHQHELDQALDLRLGLDLLSDIDMLEDWYEREYERLPQPRSFANLVHDSQRFSVSFGLRPRVNRFYTVVEELPELRIDLPRQTLTDAFPLLYHSRTSLGYRRLKWRDFDLDRPPFLTDPDDMHSARFDTLHVLTLPFDIAQRVRVVPRAGIRLTWYGDSSDGDVRPADLEGLYEVQDPFRPESLLAVTDYDDDGGSATRLAGELGLQASTKLYRVWPGARNAMLEVDGLRHIVEPYVNYTYAPDPSEDRDNLYFFDAVDRLTEQHFVRVGVDQRLQTRRNQRIYTLARVQSYADFHFSDKNDNDQDYHGFGDFGNRIDLYPTEALQAWVMAVADLDETDVRRAEAGFRVRHRNGIRYSLAYAYRDDYYPRSTFSMATSLVDLSGEHGYLVREYLETQVLEGQLYIPINEKTAGRIRLEYDIEESDLSLAMIEVIRDLHCWMGSLAVGQDNGDVAVLVMLYLKAYPNVKARAGL
ncbi:MAG: LPS assembly protein LptD [Lentisphaeria bacterium]|nr:LPS assembly protein LptD [Lentisphaeria bacterium]